MNAISYGIELCHRHLAVGALNVGLLAPTSLLVHTHLGLWMVGVLGVAMLARLAAQSAVLDGTAVTLLLRGTMWGIGWLVQAGALILTTFGFAIARRPTRAQRVGWMLAAIGALVLAVTPALSGHAIVTSQWTALAVLSDGGHVLGASGWLGSLFLLIVVGLPTLHRLDPAVRGTETVLMVNRFSETALICAALTLMTGTVSAWLHLGSITALWHTEYGWVLFLKLGVLGFVAAIGWYHWRVVRPALDRTGSAGVIRLRQSASLELLIGAVVIAITAVLVATPTPTG